MGCRHSSSPPGSPVKKISNNDKVILRSKISVHRAQVINHRILNDTKYLSASRLSITKQKTSLPLTPPQLPLTAASLERTLDGSDKYLIKRFQVHTSCLLLDISQTHILLLDDKQLRLIHLETMNVKSTILPMNCGNIQEIVWCSKLNTFLILTIDQLYRFGPENLNLLPIHQIQFVGESPRQSYMTVDDDDLLINRSFGYDIRRYSIGRLCLLQPPKSYLENENICVTTIRLNSNKILALAVSLDKKQMIDLVNLNTEQFLHRVHFNTYENISYPINLHNHGQWFAKTCVPCLDIGHCLISSDGRITRLKLFPNQDNFIRSFSFSSDNRWLVVGRQNLIEIYRPCTSLLSVV